MTLLQTQRFFLGTQKLAYVTCHLHCVNFSYAKTVYLKGRFLVKYLFHVFFEEPCLDSIRPYSQNNLLAHSLSNKWYVLFD